MPDERLSSSKVANSNGAEAASGPAAEEAPPQRVRKRRKRRRLTQGMPPSRSIFQNKVVLAICAIALLFVVLLVLIPRFESHGGSTSTAVE